MSMIHSMCRRFSSTKSSFLLFLRRQQGRTISNNPSSTKTKTTIPNPIHNHHTNRRIGRRVGLSSPSSSLLSSSSSSSKIGGLRWAHNPTTTAAAAATFTSTATTAGIHNNTYTTPVRSLAAAAGAAAAAVFLLQQPDEEGKRKYHFGEFVTNCEEATTTATTTTSTDKEEEKGIPLWPNGVSEADIDALVAEILSDKTINLALVPDVVEEKIYKSTIQLTLNLFYSMLASLDGLPILAHQVHLTRHAAAATSSSSSASSSSKNSNNPKNSKESKQMQFHKQLVERSKMVNDEILEKVADRLLANPTVNVVGIPDAIERQLYINCLKVIFRVLMVITNSFSISICGHNIRLALEPTILEESAMRVSSSSKAAVVRSSASPVDMELLKDFARNSGISPSDGYDTWSWWDRWNVKEEFMVQLHASLYGLILGIVDDIMANTKIKILSEEIDLDMIPAQKKISPNDEDESKKSKDDSNNDSVSVGSFAAASFAAGVGIGVAGMAVMASQQR